MLFRAAWITLTVHSDPNATGFKAAFLFALGDAGMSCNVVAGACHDRIFVPAERAENEMELFHELQRRDGERGTAERVRSDVSQWARAWIALTAEGCMLLDSDAGGIKRHRLRPSPIIRGRRRAIL